MSDLMDRAAVVKARWSMDMVIEQLIGEPVPHGRKINSPFNEADETPSFHVYDDSYYDYSTGRHGDVITLVRELRRCSFEEAIELLESEADNLGLEATERIAVEKPPFIFPDDVRFCRPEPGFDMWPAALSSIEGITPYVQRMLWSTISVGVKGESLAIFHRHAGREIVGIKYRHGDGKKTSEPGSDFSSYLYQPFWYPSDDGAKHCVITEGETDSWAWLSTRPNDHVYSLPSGAQSWRDKFLEQLERYDHVYIQFDNDEPGKRARDKVTSAVGWDRAEYAPIPSFYKDIREAVAAGWKPTLGIAQYSTGMVSE
jgi:CHC2-type zinc finger protein/Toprim domain-containing protein